MKNLFLWVSVLLSLTFIYFFATRITGFFIGFGEAAREFEWWNVSWHYRFRIEVNSSLEGVDWPIERFINFTNLLPYGTFDENSIRVFEYSTTGKILYEVPSQFEKEEDFDASENAVGTLVFFINGTIQPNQKRIYYVYYDVIENGAKEKANYPNSFQYSWDGQRVNINTTLLRVYIDTNRGENTSGIYHVENIYGTSIIHAESFDRTAEYIQYSNGTHNLTFDLRNNASFFEGPVRLVIKQIGDEIIFGNPEQKTNEGRVIKKYYFYNKVWFQEHGSFVKISQEFKNLAGHEILRNSTPAGALAFDLNRTIYEGIVTLEYNSQDPHSWAFAGGGGGEVVGIINLKESGTSNFYSTNSTQYGRIGIHLNSTIIPHNSFIKQLSLVYFGTGGAYASTEFLNIRNFIYNLNVTEFLPETWQVIISPSLNATIYNRNETILIIGNISFDPYNLTKHINATFDMGTASPDDDQAIILYDDGTHGDETAGDKIFTNTFDIPNDAVLGTWKINFTAYSNSSEFLNSTILEFNITDILNVSVVILNKKPMVGSTVFANIYVKNYRKDSWITGAIINCSYDSHEVLNKTDYNNGTYSINFTAPASEGVYVLSCNVTKNGNFGNGSDEFTTEPAKTSLTIIPQPSNPIVSNITLYKNDSFVIIANVSNIGNGTAYSTNITLQLLNGWYTNTSLEQCGNLEKNSYCLKSFNVTVPNGTSPGNYSINITVIWKNPDETITSNKTEVNVTVESNPRIDVKEEKVSGEAGDGVWTLIGNFTVLSVGNDFLKNISFNCVSGEACNFAVGFIPENISNLPPNSEQNVSINVTIPLAYQPGTYIGIINVSSQNDGFDIFTLEVFVPSKTYVSVTANISSYISTKITQYENETFSFKANVTNIGNGSARYVNISVSAPTNWFVSPSLQECGNVVKNEVCLKEFSITIPKSTPPGNYTINISTNWTQPDNSIQTNRTSIIVNVTSNPLINVSEEQIFDVVFDGTEKRIGNFTVLSVGNDALRNINFNCVSGEACRDFVVKFIPSIISILPPNSNQSVSINVTVPLSYPSGTYIGIINVSSQNDGFDIFMIQIQVPENRTWDLTPEYCERSMQQPEGIVCEINVTNKGNTKISFMVYPEEGNYTKVNETSFEVERLSWHVFKITYNVTDVPPSTYNSTFFVDAVEGNANPDKKIIRVSLLPYIPPIINISIVPNEIEQNSSIIIFANVTDRSGSGILWTKVNITRPDGIVDSFRMSLLGVNGSLTRWKLDYPSGTIGSTIRKGTYNVTVYAIDNIGNEGDLNSSFLVYTKLNISLSTLSERYYQGDTGSIHYTSRDLLNSPVENVSVNFTILNSQNDVIYLSPNFKTNSEGTLTPIPSFSLASDAPLGNYTLIARSRYEDKIANKIIEKQNNYTFLVVARTITVTGLFADVETSVVWYPQNIMKFGILIYDGEGKPVDPTSMNLTVYDPANNLYLIANLSQMVKQAKGFYLYQYAMPITTPSGMFLAVLNVSKGEFQTMKLKAFRVAHGGPYDVRIILSENEVPQGDYLDFILIIENKGEVSQDVFIEYWVSAQNTTYFTASEAVYTPSLSNQSFTRSAYIYSNQPLGNYLLNVRVTYDSVQPSILANASFVVVPRVLNITPPPPTYVEYPYLVTGAAPVPTPTEKIISSILISRYNNNISLARGFSRIETVIIENNGQTDLENVSLFLLGIPTTWFNITPENYKLLKKGDSKPFVINFKIPKNANVGEYLATLVATSGVVSDQKKITLTVFESIKELLTQEISKLEEELQELIVDAKVAEKEGKDVSSVFLFIDNIKTQIKAAKENLENEKFEEALKNINTAKDLILRARDTLKKLEVVKMKAVIPWWVILLSLIPVVVFVFYFIPKKKPSVVRPWIITLEKVVNFAKKRESKEDLIKEKEKLLRLLEVLEKERMRGMITSKAYIEMKKGIEKKLANVERKLLSAK